jgi:hypothetical protein
MFTRAAALSAALTLLAAGCDAEPAATRVEVREPGQGSGALLVEATVKGEATVPNAADPSRFRTRIAVVVRRGGAPVTDAVVKVNEHLLVHRGGGLYVEPTALAGLPPEVVVLKVGAGNDWLNGAVSSPGGHVFTRPSRAGEALGGTPMEVSWRRDAPADEASLDVSGWVVAGGFDDGRRAVPASSPALRPGAPARFGLWRENRVALRGGTEGSSLSVRVWNEITLTLAGRQAERALAAGD